MSYLIYARKYRPKTFEEMIGQKAVVQTLQNAIKNNRVAQAYIFSGMRGVGKTTAARIFAKALNCQYGPTPTPCNKCEFCTTINEDRSIDVLEIDGASNRGIDEVRSLRESVKYKPIHSRNKVIIIDEVHMLTRESFNALLKTLEEPPPRTIFIFATTEFHKVPATIVSRCQHFEFKKVSQKEIISHLLDITKKEKLTISPYGLSLLAEASDGSLRDAQSLLDQAVAFCGENIRDEDLKEILGVMNMEILYEVSSAIIEEKAETIFPLIEKVIEAGYDLRFLYKEMIQHFRNLLLVKSVRHPQDLLVLNPEDLSRLQEEAKKASTEEFLRYLAVLQKGESGLKFSSHPQIYMEILLVKLCHFKQIVPIKEMIQKVEQLRKDTGGGVSEVSKNPLDFQVGRKEEKADREAHTKSVSRPLPAVKKPPSDPKKPEEEKMRGAASHKREFEAALKDPTVKSFMETFKAQAISVDPIKGSEKEEEEE
ncbi:MAG: DNA polymerase III subunit gamma/tau [Candidatus Aminicenantales bacterium]